MREEGEGLVRLRRVGLHLVLVDGLPTLPAERIPDLVDGDGRLRRDLMKIGIDIFARPGVRRQLAAEIDTSQPTQGEIMARQIPRVPSVAHRWIGEMEEIAKTFAELGLTPRILEGAAEMYRFAAASPLGAERPETRDRSRGMRETITALARAASASVGQR